MAAVPPQHSPSPSPSPSTSPSPLPATAAVSRLTAAGLMVMTAALVAVTTLLAKALGRGPEALHPMMVSAGRFWFAAVVVLSVGAVLRPSFQGTAWGTHALRVGCGWGGVSLMFAAAAQMPLAEATALTFLSPVATLLLAGLLLRERVGPWRITAVVVALVGAVILIRPGTAAFQPASLLALGAAGLIGMEAILIKRLAGREPPLRILMISNSMGAVISGAAAMVVWQAPTPAQWGMLATLGVVMLIAQALYIQANRRADASFIGPFFYLTLVFAALYDWIWFGDAPDRWGTVGALVILSGAALLAWRDGRRRKIVAAPPLAPLEPAKDWESGGSPR